MTVERLYNHPQKSLFEEKKSIIRFIHYSRRRSFELKNPIKIKKIKYININSYPYKHKKQIINNCNNHTYISRNNIVRIFDPTTCIFNDLPIKFYKKKSIITGIILHPSEKFIAICIKEELIGYDLQIWDVINKNLIYSRKFASIVSLTWVDKDSMAILISTSSGEIVYSDEEFMSGKLYILNENDVFNNKTFDINCIKYNNDYTFLAIYSPNNCIKIWELWDESTRKQIYQYDSIYDMRFEWHPELNNKLISIENINSNLSRISIIDIFDSDLNITINIKFRINSYLYMDKYIILSCTSNNYYYGSFIYSLLVYKKMDSGINNYQIYQTIKLKSCIYKILNCKSNNNIFYCIHNDKIIKYKIN